MWYKRRTCSMNISKDFHVPCRQPHIFNWKYFTHLSWDFSLFILDAESWLSPSTRISLSLSSSYHHSDVDKLNERMTIITRMVMVRMTRMLMAIVRMTRTVSRVGGWLQLIMGRSPMVSPPTRGSGFSNLRWQYRQFDTPIHLPSGISAKKVQNPTLPPPMYWKKNHTFIVCGKK